VHAGYDAPPDWPVFDRSTPQFRNTLVADLNGGARDQPLNVSLVLRAERTIHGRLSRGSFGRLGRRVFIEVGEDFDANVETFVADIQLGRTAAVESLNLPGALRAKGAS
jgi:hypothetical protein